MVSLARTCRLMPLNASQEEPGGGFGVIVDREPGETRDTQGEHWEQIDGHQSSFTIGLDIRRHCWTCPLWLVLRKRQSRETRDIRIADVGSDTRAGQAKCRVSKGQVRQRAYHRLILPWWLHPEMRLEAFTGSDQATSIPRLCRREKHLVQFQKTLKSRRRSMLEC